MINLLLKQKGSIALISILIISAILLILVTGMSESNISASYQYFNKHSDQTSYYAAEACLEETIIRIEEDPNFTGTTFNFDEITCISTISGDSTKDISININYLNYTQDFQAQVSVVTKGQTNNASLLNWEKI